MAGMATLLTDRLHLRLLAEPDLGLYRSLYTCPRVMAQIGAPLAPDAATRAFAAAVRHNGLDVPGHRTFAAFDRGGGSAIGIGALLRTGDRAEIGLMLLPSAWDGQRSRELIQALVDYGFGHMGLSALDAICRKGPNARFGRRMARLLGFLESGTAPAGTTRWQLDRGRADASTPVGSVACTE